MPKLAPDPRSTIPLVFLFSLLTGPAEYIAHEAAHYLVALAFGVHPTMHFNRVELHTSPQLDPVQSLLFTAAGPAADWTVGVTALLFLARSYTPLALVFAIWIARPLQFLHALLELDLSPLGISEDLAGTDEAVIGQALGMSARQVILAELAVAIPLMLLIVYYMPVAYRLPIMSVLTTGVLLGWAAWLAVGPYLLP